ncbi:MAG: anaerobic ribonucleoside-triphosphate reductase activating protein [Actinomycetaceae bacterium]|nr:anaerobic ribonucleoside-triphosphate reductase activating protein [Actinomycetaceae bacterium]
MNGERGTQRVVKPKDSCTGSRSGCAAHDLAIAGLIPLSTVDWPDHLAAVVFCQGCPWRCPFCQNSAILDVHTPGSVPFSVLEDLLSRRHGLLDGVVFTGGEALRQAAVEDAVRVVRTDGFQVALHTGGAYPARLQRLLPSVSWVGLDIKAMPDDYREAAGFDGGKKAWTALDALIAERDRRAGTSDVFDFEVRTTVYPNAPAERRFTELVERLADLGVQNFALQQARTQGTPGEFQELAQSWDAGAWQARFNQMSVIAQNTLSNVLIRPA